MPKGPYRQQVHTALQGSPAFETERISNMPAFDTAMCGYSPLTLFVWPFMVLHGLLLRCISWLIVRWFEGVPGNPEAPGLRPEFQEESKWPEGRPLAILWSMGFLAFPLANLSPASFKGLERASKRPSKGYKAFRGFQKVFEWFFKGLQTAFKRPSLTLPRTPTPSIELKESSAD